MDDRTYNVWANLLAASALIVVAALMMVAIVWGMPRDDAADQRSATQTPTAQTDQVPQTPATSTSPTVTIPPTMTQLHETMLDQMRVVVAQPMLDQMSRDPMWRQMVTEELRAMEAIEKGLDQMLAR